MQLVEGEGWIDWRGWKAAKLRQSCQQARQSGRPANQSGQQANQSCRPAGQSCHQAFAGQWCLSCQSSGQNQCEVQPGSKVEFTLNRGSIGYLCKHKNIYCKRMDWPVTAVLVGVVRQRLVQIVEKFWEVSWSIWQQAAGETSRRRGFLRDATSPIHSTPLRRYTSLSASDWYKWGSENIFLTRIPLNEWDEHKYIWEKR